MSLKAVFCNRFWIVSLVLAIHPDPSLAGPYSQSASDPANVYDAPIPGFIGPDGEGGARLLGSGGVYQNPNNYVNPLFFDWGASIPLYTPSPGVASTWQVTTKLLGPVTGDNFDILSLGDLSAEQETAGVSPGQVVVGFSRLISNLDGADFVLFENSFATTGGQVFADLGYVEASSDGVHFARFPSRSLTPSLVGAYGTVDATNIFNLVGKHANASGSSWGTPFDLSDLANDPLVLNGTIDLQHITQLRIVDIPGNGFFKDQTGASIFDAWLTMGSGGLDLEAVGIISSKMNYASWAALQGLSGNDASDIADPDGDGLPNLQEYAFARMPKRNDSDTPTCTSTFADGRITLNFTRDERAVDLIYLVQASADLQTWITIARSVNGQPLLGVGSFTPTIAEQRASPIFSVGVVRAVAVSDVVANAGARFLRIVVSH